MRLRARGWEHAGLFIVPLYGYCPVRLHEVFETRLPGRIDEGQTRDTSIVEAQITGGAARTVEFDVSSLIVDFNRSDRAIWVALLRTAPEGGIR